MKQEMVIFTHPILTTLQADDLPFLGLVNITNSTTSPGCNSAGLPRTSDMWKNNRRLSSASRDRNPKPPGNKNVYISGKSNLCLQCSMSYVKQPFSIYRLVILSVNLALIRLLLATIFINRLKSFGLSTLNRSITKQTMG